MYLITANEATAGQRRVYFHLVDVTDGITAETGEAGGQPQISTNGGAWTNTGIGTLSAIGNGRYYADLTQGAVGTAGDRIETRYKSANTAECPGDSVAVVAFDPYDIVRLGLTALPNAAAEAAGGLYTRGTGAGQINQNANGQMDTRIVTMATDVITSTAIAASATDKIWSEDIAGVLSNHPGELTIAAYYLNAVNTGVATLLARITSSLFTGITSLAQWLGLMAGKQVGNATARTEIRATGAGSGTYDETTDSPEAIRDRGDAAWTTGGGGGGNVID